MAKRSEEMKVFYMDPNSKAFKAKFAKAAAKDEIDRTSAYRGARIALATYYSV